MSFISTDHTASICVWYPRARNSVCGQVQRISTSRGERKHHHPCAAHQYVYPPSCRSMGSEVDVRAAEHTEEVEIHATRHKNSMRANTNSTEATQCRHAINVPKRQPTCMITEIVDSVLEDATLHYHDVGEAPRNDLSTAENCGKFSVQIGDFFPVVQYFAQALSSKSLGRCRSCP